MVEFIIYGVFLVIFFAITFKVLKALNIEKNFKTNHVWEIKAAYIIFSLISAHLLAEIVLKFYEWATLIINGF